MTGPPRAEARHAAGDHAGRTTAPAPVGAVRAASSSCCPGAQVAASVTSAGSSTAYVSNLLQLLAGLAAAVAAGRRARYHHRPGPRRPGPACRWAPGPGPPGQGWWCWVRSCRAARRRSPRSPTSASWPSRCWPPAALLLQPTADGSTGPLQRTLDAAMTSAAVGLVSWETTLGAVVAANTGDDVLTVGPAGRLPGARRPGRRARRADPGPRHRRPPPQGLVVLGLVAFSVVRQRLRLRRARPATTTAACWTWAGSPASCSSPSPRSVPRRPAGPRTADRRRAAPAVLAGGLPALRAGRPGPGGHRRAGDSAAASWTAGSC